jgi:hypothetical protein
MFERFYTKLAAKEFSPLQPEKYRHTKWEVKLVNDIVHVVEGSDWTVNGRNNTVVFRDCYGDSVFMTTTTQLEAVTTLASDVREIPKREEI